MVGVRSFELRWANAAARFAEVCVVRDACLPRTPIFDPR
jgi:hypothetical protein